MQGISSRFNLELSKMGIENRCMIKNIVFITPYFAPAWSYGGPPRALFTLARQFLKLGKNVNVITTDVLDEKRNPILKETLDGIKIIRFKTISNYLSYKMKLIISPYVLKNSKEIIQQADAILFSDIRAIINWQLYSFVYNLQKPYGIFAFGEIPHGSGFKAKVKKIMDLFWVNDFVKKATFRFAQTLHEQQMFLDYFKLSHSHTQLLPLPIPIELKQQKVDKKLSEYYKKRWGINNEDQVILFVGRLHFLKGIDLLIKAVIPLLRDDSQLKLLIVGRDDGEERNLLKLVDKEFKNKIIFVGPLYEKNVVCAYNFASCFVLTPRFYEETSLAALEALSFGVPVIVSKQADIPYLEEYKAGYVINNDPKMIQGAIIELLGKIKEDKAQVKANTQKLISDKFSASTVARKFLSIIDKNKL